jgi:hypothetical protein
MKKEVPNTNRRTRRSPTLHYRQIDGNEFFCVQARKLKASRQALVHASAVVHPSAVLHASAVMHPYSRSLRAGTGALSGLAGLRWLVELDVASAFFGRALIAST